MRKTLDLVFKVWAVGLVTFAVLFTAGQAFAYSAPSAPGLTIVQRTQNRIYVEISKPSCDADGDFGYNGSTWLGYYEAQTNGVQVGLLSMSIPNCGQSDGGGFVFGGGGMAANGPLPCGWSGTIRIRAADAANHRGAFTSITGSQGAKTLPC